MAPAVSRKGVKSVAVTTERRSMALELSRISANMSIAFLSFGNLLKQFKLEILRSCLSNDQCCAEITELI